MVGSSVGVPVVKSSWEVAVVRSLLGLERLLSRVCHGEVVVGRWLWRFYGEKLALKRSLLGKIAIIILLLLPCERSFW